MVGCTDVWFVGCSVATSLCSVFFSSPFQVLIVVVVPGFQCRHYIVVIAVDVVVVVAKDHFLFLFHGIRMEQPKGTLDFVACHNCRAVPLEKVTTTTNTIFADCLLLLVGKPCVCRYVCMCVGGYFVVI